MVRVPSRKVPPFVNIPCEAIGLLIKFESFNYLKLKQVSKLYKEKVCESIDDICNSVENGFVGQYYDALFYKSSFTWTKPIQFCGQKGLRIDRVFECELQAQAGYTLTIGCSFTFYNDPKTYRAEYKLDTKKKGSSRETWVHIDRQH